MLRACELAGVPAVEVRVISNDIGEGDRSRWMMRRALEVLDGILPRLPGERRPPVAVRSRMARRADVERRELPPPLPPERADGRPARRRGDSHSTARNSWQCARDRGSVAVVNALVWGAPGSEQIVVAAAGALLVTLSYVVACSIVTGASLRSRRALVAYAIGVLVFVPFPFLAALFVLPGLLWLSLFGLAVPVALVEGLGVRAALVRGLEARRAWTSSTCSEGSRRSRSSSSSPQASLFFVLREFADNTRIAAATLASIVVSPLRLPRSGAPVRRPGSSVTLARRATRGARCRPT